MSRLSKGSANFYSGKIWGLKDFTLGLAIATFLLLSGGLQLLAGVFRLPRR
jgi:hypothetical protein